MHNHEFSRKFSVIFTSINRFLPLIFWVLIIYSFDEPLIATLTVISAVIHELGHFSFFIFTRSPFPTTKGVYNGFRISRSETLSYKGEIILALLGPLFNIAACFVILPFRPVLGGFADSFAVLNLATGLSNLLPIEGYDGYRIIKCSILLMTCPEQLLKILDILSDFLIALFVFLSLYLIERFNSGYWIYAVFIVSLVGRVFRALKFQKTSF